MDVFNLSWTGLLKFILMCLEPEFVCFDIYVFLTLMCRLFVFYFILSSDPGGPMFFCFQLKTRCSISSSFLYEIQNQWWNLYLNCNTKLKSKWKKNYKVRMTNWHPLFDFKAEYSVECLVFAHKFMSPLHIKN